MHVTGSFLYTVLERIRGYLDDPDFDAKYNNDFIIRHIISPTMVDVWSRVNMNLDNPVVLILLLLQSITNFLLVLARFGECVVVILMA
jgi:hypothetical protein